MPKEFETWIKKIEKSLKKEHPKMKSKDIKEMAFAIARKEWRSSKGFDPISNKKVNLFEESNLISNLLFQLGISRNIF